MDARKFDTITRAMSRPASRRGILAGAGALIAARLQRAGAAPAAAPAAQLGPPTCGSAGDVCTMLLGCCSGLTCVTSAINVNYGVCVTGGDGGTVAAGTGLISPFSETITDEIGTITTQPATSTAPTPEEQRAERQAKRDARKTRKGSRRTSRRSRRTSRRTTKENERELRKGPRLELRLTNPGGINGEPEIVRVTNRDDVTAYLTGIEATVDPSDFHDFVTPVALSPGTSFLFVSGESFDLDGNRIGWADPEICRDQVEGEGFTVFAHVSSSSRNKAYTVYCDGSESDSDAAARRRKKRKKQREKAKKKRRKKNG